MPLPDRDKDVEKLLRVLEKPAAQARLRELLGLPSLTYSARVLDASQGRIEYVPQAPGYLDPTPIRVPSRAERLSQALAELHEAHRRVKKANRTQAQTISKLQADLAAAKSNRDGAIQNASDYFHRLFIHGDVLAIQMRGAPGAHRYKVIEIDGHDMLLEALPDDA